MPLIVACSVIALTITIERYFALDKEDSAATPISHCLARSKAGRVIGTKAQIAARWIALRSYLVCGLANRGQGRDVMKESIQEAASHVVHDLEKYLNTLELLLRCAFTRSSGDSGWDDRRVQPDQVLAPVMPTHSQEGISEALITTAGLIVAIPALVMHRYFTGMIDTIVVELEREAIKLVDALHGSNNGDYTLEI